MRATPSLGSPSRDAVARRTTIAPEGTVAIVLLIKVSNNTIEIKVVNDNDRL